MNKIAYYVGLLTGAISVDSCRGELLDKGITADEITDLLEAIAPFVKHFIGTK